MLTALPALAPTGTGETLEFFGERVDIKIHGEQTNGAYAVLEFTTPAGVGAPPHLHDREDEVFLVRGGRLRILANGGWHDVGPGDVVFAPRGHVHAFENPGPGPANFWLVVTPAGFEEFYRELCQEFAGETAPEAGRMTAICRRHGIHLFEPVAG